LADFEKAIIIIMKNEGGYVNSKYDAGGETKFGITKKVARFFGYKGSMYGLTIVKAKEIYRKGYWDKLLLDFVKSQKIANEIFDTAVNCGNTTAIRFVQRALNVLNRYGRDWKDIKVDGKMGPNTIKTINLCIQKREKNLLKTLNILQGNYYIKLAENPNRKDEMNINGWIAHRIKL